MIKIAEIFLENQRRHRSFKHYEVTLHFDGKKDLLMNKSVLVIGGGTGVYTFGKYDLPDASITNIDLHIDSYDINKNPGINSVQGDFTQSDFPTDNFDEIWALFSLPLYSVSVPAVKLFFLKALLSLKPGGSFRIAPCTPHKFANNEKSAIKRALSQKVILKNLYKISNWFAENCGGSVDFIWADENFADMPDSYSVSNIKEPTKISSAPERRCLEYFNFSQYKSITHYRSNSNPYEDCIIVSKSINDSDKTNRLIEREIKNLYKQYDKTGIIVHTANETVKY